MSFIYRKFTISLVLLLLLLDRAQVFPLPVQHSQGKDAYAEQELEADGEVLKKQAVVDEYRGYPTDVILGTCSLFSLCFFQNCRGKIDATWQRQSYVA